MVTPVQAVNHAKTEVLAPAATVVKTVSAAAVVRTTQVFVSVLLVNANAASTAQPKSRLRNRLVLVANLVSVSVVTPVKQVANAHVIHATVAIAARLPLVERFVVMAIVNAVKLAQMENLALATHVTATLAVQVRLFVVRFAQRENVPVVTLVRTVKLVHVIHATAILAVQVRMFVVRFAQRVNVPVVTLVRTVKLAHAIHATATLAAQVRNHVANAVLQENANAVMLAKLDPNAHVTLVNAAIAA